MSTVRSAGGLSGSPTVSASGCTGDGVIVGAVLGVEETVTVAVSLSACPPGPETLTQKEIVAASGGVVYDAEVAPAIGLPVSPEVPAYHW